jgi:hypothetical protein
MRSIFNLSTGQGSEHVDLYSQSLIDAENRPWGNGNGKEFFLQLEENTERDMKN